MSEPFLSKDRWDNLDCPLCGAPCIHLNDVYMAGRPEENGPFLNVAVHANGQVEQGNDVKMPISIEGYRHTIVLGGYCEDCDGRFALQFRQHKGQTQVAAVPTGHGWIS